MVGTQALLGEGWDAPFVNTLIMASSISSYVTSNQIRGVKIIHNATQEDVTDNFNSTWIVGTITGVDIGIT